MDNSVIVIDRGESARSLLERVTAQQDYQNRIVNEVLAEIARATKKFPGWPTDPLHALAVLGEEFGELTRAMLQRTYEPHKATTEDVRTEAVQTAAMALRLLFSLDCYEYKPCAQHAQTASPQKDTAGDDGPL